MIFVGFVLTAKFLLWLMVPGMAILFVRSILSEL